MNSELGKSTGENGASHAKKHRPDKYRSLGNKEQ